MAQLVDFGKQAIETASDMQEVQNVVDTAFGETKQKMEDFADTCIETYGISKLTAKQTGSTFMAMASGMGLANGYASDMSVALTGLSADMASFYNVSQDVASTALKSIFTGETETLKQFGIVMTDANLQAYALSQGITKATSEMSQAEKVQLRYGYVMQQTALAQGDFAKTSDGWANQTRMLSEKWKEFGSTIGAVLLNVALPVVRKLNDIMSELISATQSAANALSELFGIENDTADSAKSMALSTADTAEEYSDIAESAENTEKSQKNQVASFDKINKLGESKSSIADSGGSGINTGLYDNQGTISTKIDIDAKDATSKLTDFFNSIKRSFSIIFKPIQNSWKTYGKSIIDSVKKALDGISSLLGDIGSSLETVWTNGSGEIIVGHILEIFRNISTTVGNIADRLKTAWTADNLGTDIIQHSADIFDTILSHVEYITGKISDWSGTIDFEPLLSSFDTLLQALEPFADNVGEGLEWFLDNVLLPLASWTIEDLIPTFFDTLSDVISGLNTVWETAEPVLQRLWDNFLQPLASWAADTALSVLQGIGSAFKTLCENVTEKDVENMIKLAGAIGAIILVSKSKQAIDNIGKSFEGLKGSVTKGIASLKQPATMSLNTVALAIQSAIAGWTIGAWIYDSYSDEIDGALYPIYDAVTGAWNALVEWVKSIPQSVAAIPEELNQNVIEPMKGALLEAWKCITDDVENYFVAPIIESFQAAWNGIKEAWNSVTSWFGEKWDGICEVFAYVKEWFGEKFTSAWVGIKSAFSTVGEFFGEVWTAVKSPFLKVSDWFKNTFQEAWEGVKSVFSEDGEIFSGIKEGISETFFTVVNGLIDGINWVIAKPFEAINDAIGWIKDIEILDWQPFSGLSRIDIPQIPKLATGTVVPANYGEFLAVLGDNKRETEVVSPLSTIKQAVREAMGEAGGGAKQPAVLKLIVKGKELAEVLIDDINDMTSSSGECPIKI